MKKKQRQILMETKTIIKIVSQGTKQVRKREPNCKLYISRVTFDEIGKSNKGIV